MKAQTHIWISNSIVIYLRNSSAFISSRGDLIISPVSNHSITLDAPPINSPLAYQTDLCTWPLTMLFDCLVAIKTQGDILS